MERVAGNTFITGNLVDQAHLLGLVERIQELGLELISVGQASEPDSEWEKLLAQEPAGVYEHSDGKPLLGRKLAGKSWRELHDLGLIVENGELVDSPTVGVAKR